MPRPAGPWLWRAVRLGASLLLPHIGWTALGAVGLLLTAPVVAALWSPALAEALTAKVAGARRWALTVEGAHHAWRGHPVRVLQLPPVTQPPWLMAEDLRRAGLALPGDARLQAWLPGAQGCRWVDGPGPAGWALRADALAQALKGSQDLHTRRFLVWLDREVLGTLRQRSRAGPP